MTVRLAATLLVTAACLPAALAEDAVPRTPKAPPYVLKNKSVFTPVSDDVRAPFSPIGWTKAKAAANAEPARVALPRVMLDQSSFKVSSILLGSPSLAIINGRTYSEGEFLRVGRPAAGPATVPALPAGLRVRVFRINDGGVVLQNQEQLLTVALARPELLQRNSVEELLSEDRP